MRESYKAGYSAGIAKEREQRLRKQLERYGIAPLASFTAEQQDENNADEYIAG